MSDHEDQGGGTEVLEGDTDLHEVNHVEDLYREWFLEYASYVILDRAVPFLDDGLKPVQRRILHAMYELEDGRFNKAANIIGHTMRYHPHGDQAIGDAMVKLAQKDLLIETQGNWGNVATGDRAAAPRYIEARLSSFAKDVVFNPKTTSWIPSYDGRNNEPVSLPVKFPLLLAQGAEGIAVGLSTRILPHNFCELIKSSIKFLRGKSFKLYPDFQAGGLADFSQYNDGKKGGKIKVRAVLEKEGGKIIRIRELPAGVTTSSLIDSILAANDKGKIKVRRVEDNTAKDVDILIELPSGASPELTVQGLYAFTDCEVSISVNCCIIQEDKPKFVGVSDLLRVSTDNTKEYLKTELEIARNDLQEKLHFAGLEKIFIEKKIYRKIETAETWEGVLSTIDKGLKPYAKTFFRKVTPDDLVRLTEIKIKRISKFDIHRAEEAMVKLENSLAEVEYDLKHLVDYTIRFFENILEKYGKGRERKTKATSFEEIKVQRVAVANQKLFVNRKEGFIGFGLKKDELVCECSDIDEVIAFTKAGTFKVSKVASKVFMGKDIIHVAIFKRGDDRRIYHMIYQDGRGGNILAKRFNVGGITRDKEYELTKATKGTKVLYFSDNANGESETVTCHLKPKPKQRRKKYDVDFGEMEVKSRSVKGYIVTSDAVAKVEQLSRGDSTLEAQKVWFDAKSGKLNHEEAGVLLGEFSGDEILFVIYEDGAYELVPYKVNHYFSGKVEKIQLFEEQVLSVIYYEGDRKDFYVKRFKVDADSMGKRVEFISQSKGTKVHVLTTQASPLVKVTFKKDKDGTPRPELLRVADFIDIKGHKAMGNRLSKNKVKSVQLL